MIQMPLPLIHQLGIHIEMIKAKHIPADPRIRNFGLRDGVVTTPYVPGVVSSACL